MHVHSPYGFNLSMPIPEGDDGTAATLWAMKAIADDAAEHSFRVHQVAAEVMNAIQADPMGGARWLYEWLIQRVKFRKDPWQIEHVRHPNQLLAEIAQNGRALGDCDDVATLAVAILKAAGYSPVLIVVGRKISARFEHVLYGVLLSGGVFPIDSQHRHFGQLPPGVQRVFSFPV